MTIKVKMIGPAYFRIKDDESHDWVDIIFIYDPHVKKYIAHYDWTNSVKEMTEEEYGAVVAFLAWLSQNSMTAYHENTGD